jgi:signal transduction histidine kinase
VCAPPGAMVKGDAAALSCAIANLISNAVKYSRPGGQIRVTLEIGPERATLAVTDEGIGIEAAEVRHLFDPFFRGSNAVRAQIRGAGIGLSLVKNIVEAHQGSVTVKSKVDKGSTFTLVLPLARVSADREEQAVGRE